MTNVVVQNVASVTNALARGGRKVRACHIAHAPLASGQPFLPHNFQDFKRLVRSKTRVPSSSLASLSSRARSTSPAPPPYPRALLHGHVRYLARASSHTDSRPMRGRFNAWTTTSASPEVLQAFLVFWSFAGRSAHKCPRCTFPLRR